MFQGTKAKSFFKAMHKLGTFEIIQVRAAADGGAARRGAALTIARRTSGATSTTSPRP
jgi:hypothetical protein